MEEGRSAFKILKGTPSGKRPSGRPRRRCQDNIRSIIKEIGVNTRNWVDLASNYLRCPVNAALNSGIHNSSSKFGSKISSSLQTVLG